MLKSFLRHILNFLRRKISFLKLFLSASHKYKKNCKVQTLLFNPEAFQTTHKICFFSHFSENGEVSSSVKHYLTHLKNCGFVIVLCSTSPQLSAEALKTLQDRCDLILLRENIGFDFGSWAICFNEVLSRLPDYFKTCLGMLWANDSVIGPLYPLKPIFERMLKQDYDFWGLTENHYPKSHLQSYFLYFSKNLIQSPVLGEFINNLNFYHDKKMVIMRYEIGLSQMLGKGKWRRGVAFPYREVFSLAPERVPLSQRPDADPTVFYWDILIEMLNFPFLKRSVVHLNPQGVLEFKNYVNVIEKTSIDIRMIDLIINDLK